MVRFGGVFTAIVSALAVRSFRGVNGHGYLYSPRSLNWRAHEDGLDWIPDGQEEGNLMKEYCHHCLNTKQSDEVCGNSGNRNYDDFRDYAGNLMPWVSEATYTEGQVIEVKSYLSAHHWGHLEMKACPSESPSQSCFDEHRLEYVFDQNYAYGAPADANNPAYGHYSDKSRRDYTHKFQLPQGLTGQKVTLQYTYITANSCNPPGYVDYPWPSSDWWSGATLSACTLPYEPDGSRTSGSPEQFWNCAQVTILPSSPTISPKPTEQPVLAPTEPPVTTVAPVPVTPSPVFQPITPTAPPPGTNVATSTRYWDCSGGSCGCAYLPDHLQGDNDKPAHCYSNALFAAPQGNSYGAKFYGTAAVSNVLGGSDWLGDACGMCWKVTGTSNVPNYEGVSSTLVLRAANYCPPENYQCNGAPHFDIAAPGFDVTQFSLSNSCNEREPEETAGFESCGTWMQNAQDPDIGCDCSYFNDPTLRAGCENFYSLKWDNPSVIYEAVECPPEMVTPCWEENAGSYPPFGDIPETCMSPTTGNPPTAPTIPPPPPSPTPLPTAPVNPNTDYNDNRLVAYLGNWQLCPTAEQVAAYTHIVIAFAVSYTWSPGKNICSTTCEIGMPPVCNNADNPALVQQWQAAGKKVLLSYGGAGMGGSWDGDVNDCWDYCFGREEQVVTRLTSIINTLGLDGIDIDYEYFYEDGQKGSTFDKGAEAQKFLTDVTLGMKNSLDPGSIVAHAPMDTDLVPGKGYFDVLESVGWALDFLMPQYYNGIIRPLVNGMGPRSPGLAHYNTIKDSIFNGDPTKIIFGFCISDCSGTGTNTNAGQAVAIMSELEQTHECNGGVFFWVAAHDINGEWSSEVGDAIAPNVGCSSTSSSPSTASSHPPTPEVTPSPTHASTSTPTPSPTSTPSFAPSSSPTSPATPAPTSPPIPVPTSPPTPTPTSPPIPVPTSPPTFVPTTPPIPVPTSPPTPIPTTPKGVDYCCSWDSLTCPGSNGDWCNLSEDNCMSGCSGSAWIDPAAVECRLGVWANCKNDPTGCCAPSTCVWKSKWYSQCLPV